MAAFCQPCLEINENTIPYNDLTTPGNNETEGSSSACEKEARKVMAHT